ncbi:MAG: hypothetical protein BWY78_00261 [Alphaproteobacteria bacterium ADurb.Bin438]|nr:MAG: hypothetical protein BWY78_00261 [Alphaproteobacteria bacterium ADurb.Bin438]
MNKFIFTIIAFLFITSPLKSYGVEVDAEAIKSQEIYNEAFKKANKKDWKAVSKSLKNKEMDNEILNKTLKWMRFIDEKEKIPNNQLPINVIKIKSYLGLKLILLLLITG